MKTIRLTGVLCITLAGYLLTAFQGPAEFAVAGAVALTALGVALFGSGTRKTALARRVRDRSQRPQVAMRREREITPLGMRTHRAMPGLPVQ